MALAAGIALALATGRPLWGVVAGGLIAASGRRPLPAANTLSVLLFLAAAGLVATGWPLEEVLAGGLAWFVVHQRSTNRRPATDVLLVGLLLVVAATRTRSPWFGAALTGWMLGIGPRLGAPVWVGLPLVVLVLPLFLLTPRFVPSDLRERDARGLTGFSADVELGAMQDLLDDPSRVFTATFDRPIDEPPYFRGVALDRFDGRRWWSEAPRTREPPYDGALADAVRVDVDLDAHAETVLFVPGTPDGVDADGLAIERDAGGAYHLPGPPRDVAYTAWVRPPFGPGRTDPFLDAAPTVALPPLPTDVRALYADVVGDRVTPAAKMDALTGWLRDTYTYTRAPRDLDVEAPLPRFLLETRAGHCEYFASALAVGGRVAGVPTRVVNGFVGGEPVSPTELVVRRYHAHSWVEYFDGEQWVTVDPTPPADVPRTPGVLVAVGERLDTWWTDLVAFDGDRQIAVAERLATRIVPDAGPRNSVVLGALLIGGVVGGLLLVAGRLLRADPAVEEATVVDPVTRLVVEARGVLVERGWVVPAHLPDVAFAEWVAARDANAGAAMLALAWASYRVRFGGAEPAAELPVARQALATLREVA
jgi:transglutaminase-like putative cysteine protease